MAIRPTGIIRRASRSSLGAIDLSAKRLCEQNLLRYIRDAWNVLEPTIPFLLNWHHELMAEYLEAVTAGEVTRLLINVPPRYSKSRMVSVLWPTWCWARRPEDKLSPDDVLTGAGSRWIFASYADELVIEHSVDRRTVLESPWYRNRWGDRVSFTKDQNRKTNYKNKTRGAMFSTSIAGSAGLGEGGDGIIIDDPHNTKGAESELQRKADLETFRSTLSTRHNDKKRGVIVIIMQRLNELDLAGYLLELGGWEHLKITGEFEERRVYIFPRSKRQIIRESDHTMRIDANGHQHAPVPDGGLLWPAREGPKEIAERKLNLGSMGFAAQYQQRPAPKGGALFKHEWWKYWRVLPQLHRIIMAMDTAYEEGDDNSFSNCDVWGLADIGFVLVDNWHQRVQFPELKRAAVWMAAKWNPEAILIEARASGRSLIQELKRPIPVGSNEPTNASIPIVPIEPEVDKYTRAVAVTPIPEAGLVWLPEETAAPWIVDYRKELELFPAGKLNDRVDTLVHSLTYLRGQGSIVDLWRRLQQHYQAVEAAQDAHAQGRKPPPRPENPVMTAYLRSSEMWRKKREEESRRF
jgi:predicted phage terminase large subunit-like protein